MMEAIVRIVKRTRVLGLAAAALLAASGLASAQTAAGGAADEEGGVLDEVSLKVGADLYSKYVWRGMLLTDDPVVQPSLTLGVAGFSFNVWGSIDMTDVNEDTPGDLFSPDGPTYRMQELDYTFSYGFSPVDGVDLELGYIHYTFPGTVFERTEEVYAKVGVAVPYLAPSLTVYWDFDEADGIYATLGIGHTFALNEALGLSIGGSIGYGDKNYHEFYFGPDSNRLSDYKVTASLDYAVTDNFSVSFIAAYTDFISGTIEDAAEVGYGDSGNFYAGLSFGFSF